MEAPVRVTGRQYATLQALAKGALAYVDAPDDCDRLVALGLVRLSFDGMHVTPSGHLRIAAGPPHLLLLFGAIAAVAIIGGVALSMIWL